MSMNKQEKEDMVNKLLCFILDDLENNGATYNGKFYNFYLSKDAVYLHSRGLITSKENIEHSFTVFQRENKILDEQMKEILNYCTSHELLKKNTLGVEFESMTLTQKGYALAMSIEKAKTYQPEPNMTQNFNIGTITATNVQIGNNNTQNITVLEKYFTDEIDESNASPEEKEKAKSLLQSLLKNNIISGIIANLSYNGITKLFGD